jgi:mRNA-degrading endonuclease RelE of RelBE toxin-antitoxin system
MTYELAFLDEALKEWRKLDDATREQLTVVIAIRDAMRAATAALHIAPRPACDRRKSRHRDSGVDSLAAISPRSSFWLLPPLLP